MEMATWTWPWRMNSGNVSVLLGNGDGSFQSAVNYGADDGPSSVAIGDLNGDGDLDLAVANRWSANVSVLLGNGDGSFPKRGELRVGDGPCSVAIGDLNGDGDLDLAVANSKATMSRCCWAMATAAFKAR